MTKPWCGVSRRVATIAFCGGSFPAQSSVRRGRDFRAPGVIVDTETTGLDRRKGEIVEIGAVAFTFDDDGTIADVTGVYRGLQQPLSPIPPEITRLTGITDEMG